MKKKRQILWHELFFGITMLFFGLALASVFHIYDFFYALITFSLTLNGFFVLLFVSFFLFILFSQAKSIIRSSLTSGEFLKYDEKLSLVEKIIDVISRIKMMLIILVMMAFLAVTLVDEIDTNFLFNNYATGLFFILTIVFFFLTAISVVTM